MKSLQLIIMIILQLFQMSFKRSLKLENHAPTTEVTPLKPNHYVNDHNHSTYAMFPIAIENFLRSFVQ